VQQIQTAEGVASGTTVTTTNSATSGDAYTTVTIPTSGTFAYDNAHAAHGTQSFKIATGGTSGTNVALQSFTGVPVVWGRFYIYTTDWTSSQNIGARLRSAGTQVVRFCFDSSGHLSVKNTGNTVVLTGTVALSNATWYRVEFMCDPGTSTTGAATMTVYALDSTSPIDSVTTSTQNFGTGNVDEYGIGLFTAAASVSPFWIDDTVINDSGYPGPAAVAAALTDSSTLTDGLSVATGGTAVPLSDSATLTDGLTVTGSTAIALTDSSTLTDSLSAAAGTGGVPFRPEIWPGGAIIVELAVGADRSAAASTWSWTDVTADVMNTPGLSGVWGRADETSQSQPASMTFQLLNLSGAYSAYALGNLLNKGTPVRVRRTLGITGVGSGPIVEFLGFATGFPPGWDTTGKLPIVTVAAYGRMRELGQPKAPTYSPLYRALAIGSAGEVLSWWSGEEPAGSTFSPNQIPGGTNLVLRTGTATWGTATPPAGASGAIDISTAGTQLRGSLATSTPATYLTGHTVGLAFRATASAAGGVRPLAQYVMTGTGYQLDLYITDGTGAGLVWNINDGGAVTQLGVIAGNFMDGNWHGVRVQLTPHFPGVGLVRAELDTDLGNTSQVLGTVFLGPLTTITLGAVTGIGQAAPVNIGDLQVTAIYAGTFGVTDTVSPVDGYTGENPIVRMERMCAEDGIPIVVWGPNSDVTMGPQLIDSLLANLRDCEKADGGVLFDGYDDGVGYQSQSARYNMGTIMSADIGQGQIAPPFAPADDDQRLVNQFAASMGSGGAVTATAESTSPMAPAKVGLYPGSDSFNVADPGQLLGIAGWRVNLGTVYGLRYPTVAFNFISPGGQLLAPYWMYDVLQDSCPVGWRLSIPAPHLYALNHPAARTLDLMVEGYAVTSDLFSWSAVLNTSPYAPWEVGAVQDPLGQYGRIAPVPGASTASSAASTTATSLQIASPAGQLWSTAAADRGFWAYLNTAGQPGGELIWVQTITGSSSPQTFTVLRSQNFISRAVTVGDVLSLADAGVIAR